MSRKKNKQKNASDTSSNNDDAQKIETSGWVDREVETKRLNFPERSSVDEPLRIAFTSSAHDAIVSHAQDDLTRELCGVLLGTVCEDAEGVWISVEVALRGETDKQGGTHVTYTHETWEKIYAEKDKKHPKLAILGWYHTHPGFGVQFSEMDLFIQRNFFSADTQVAFVIDPKSEEEAIVANTSHGVEYVSRYWVGGKERKTLVPRGEQSSSSSESNEVSAEMSVELDNRLRDVEDRLSQVLASNEQQREAYGRLFLISALFFSLVFIGFVSYFIYQNIVNRVLPPKNLHMAEVPIKFNDEVMKVGIQVNGLKIPDGMNVMKKDLERIDAAMRSELAKIEASMDSELAKREAETMRRLSEALEKSESKDAKKFAAEIAAVVAAEKPYFRPDINFYWALTATALLIVLGVFIFVPGRR